MTLRNKDLVVYFSPSGNTRKVADIIANTLNQMGQKAVVFDLAAKDEKDHKELAVDTLNRDGCLWVGSPVYAHHALPQVTDFISGLPVTKTGYAVPFVTYGGVTSGMALYKMGQILTENGFRLLGAAKIVAVHSMMWRFKNPLGEGHPNDEDKAMVRDLIKAVHEKFSNPDRMSALTPDQLNYQPKNSQEAFHHADIKTTKKIFPPMKFDADLCTECGVCKEECPTRNIVMEPSFQFGDNCIFCYDCVRTCETGAITNDIFHVINDRLRMLASKYSETSGSMIFL